MSQIFLKLALLPWLGHKEAIGTSDEPEPSWLEPGLELNNFQLGSARPVTFSVQLGLFSIKARKSALFSTFFFFANQRNFSLLESPS